MKFLYLQKKTHYFVFWMVKFKKKREKLKPSVTVDQFKEFQKFKFFKL